MSRKCACADGRRNENRCFGSVTTIVALTGIVGLVGIIVATVSLFQYF
jgi:hypothetical protein